MSASGNLRRLRDGLERSGIDGIDRDVADELARELALDKLDPPLTITAATIIGEGADGVPYLELSNGTEIHWRSVLEMTTAKALMGRVNASTGAIPKLDNQGAMRVVALLKRCARHIKTMTELDQAVEWLVTFLQAADVLDADFHDQGQRWAAFSHLKDVDPRARHRESGISIAASSTVLRHPDGSRLVRTDWLRAYVRSIEPGVTPMHLAALAQRLGWVKRGKEGRWLARDPLSRDSINWAFWLVPPGWEDRGDSAPAGPVTADKEDPPRACAHTRVGAGISRNEGTGRDLFKPNGSQVCDDCGAALTFWGGRLICVGCSSREVAA